MVKRTVHEDAIHVVSTDLLLQSPERPTKEFMDEYFKGLKKEVYIDLNGDSPKDDDTIQITLTKKQAAKLLNELHTLEGYKWNDDSTHRDDCHSKVLEVIQEQVDAQDK